MHYTVPCKYIHVLRSQKRDFIRPNYFQHNVPFSTCLLTGRVVNGVISRLPICSSSNILTFGKLEKMKKVPYMPYNIDLQIKLYLTICLKKIKFKEKTVSVRADLHDTTLSHAASLRQAYNMNCFV